MANTIFTNLNVLESGKGGLNQIFNNKQDMGNLNNSLGNVNKEFGDGKKGSFINKQVSTDNAAYKNNINKGKKTSDDGPNNVNKSVEANGKVDKNASSKVPMKNNIESQQKPWMTQTDPGPEAKVSNNAEDYNGNVTTKKQKTIQDSDKQEQMDYMNEQNNKSTEKQRVKEYDHQNRNQYKPQPLKNTIGEGPKVMDNPVHGSVKDYNMKSPQNPNPEMYPGASKATGQAPTPRFPTNNVTKMVSGMKQPPTAKPSMKLPRG